MDTTLEQKPFSNYIEIAQPAIKALKSNWDAEKKATTVRRALRRVDIDADKERDSGVLDKDAEFIPSRLIDSNIKKEQAKHAAYLTKSPRSVILTCNEDPTIDGSPLEKHFTNAARYNGWELPLLKWVDGVESHAWDFCEVAFDKSKPGHFAINHVGHERLLFINGIHDIQASDFLVREKEFTGEDILKLVQTAGFDPEQASKILASNNNTDKNSSSNPNLARYQNRILEQVYYKSPEDDFVYVAWSCVDICDGWLRAPRKLFLGQVELQVNQFTQEKSYIQLFETSYPYEIDVYSISEDECIEKLQGRVDLDKDTAQAITSLMSSACTMMKRACQNYWTLKDNEGMASQTTLEEAQSDIKVAPNRVFNKALAHFTMPTPPPEVFGAISQLKGQSQQDAGNIDYAVQSNKSTRKTSAEVKLASKDNDMISSVQVTLRSIALRNAYTRAFNLYISRVRAGLIIVPPVVQNLIVNYSWTLKPAGDVDVIERQQKIQRMQEAYPVYAQSGAKNVYLKKLTELLFPDEAPIYIKAIEESEQEGKFTMAMLEVLKGLVEDAKNGEQYLANKAPQLQELLQQGTMMMQQQGEGGTSTTTQQPLATDKVAPSNEIEMAQQV